MQVAFRATDNFTDPKEDSWNCGTVNHTLLGLQALLSSDTSGGTGREEGGGGCHLKTIRARSQSEDVSFSCSKSGLERVG